MKALFSTLLVIIAFGLTGCNELRRSEARIKQEILEDAPFGSDISEVLDYLKKQNFEIRSVNRDGGFYDQRTKPAKETGEMSIKAYFGRYKKVFSSVSVVGYFAFDKEGKLTDIWVWKTTDAP